MDSTNDPIDSEHRHKKSDLPSAGSGQFKQFLNDYGMIFVLLALVVLFSLLTITEQSPTGESAGRQVAKLIQKAYGDKAFVMIVTRDTEGDKVFSEAVSTHLKAQGVPFDEAIYQTPRSALLAIQQKLTTSPDKQIVIATLDTVKAWPVFENPKLSSVKSHIVTPRPYTWPNFLKAQNLLGVANQTAIYAIIAIGMTLVIITSGIDLSVGSLVALAAVAGSLVMRENGGKEASTSIMLSGLFAGILICALAGAFNGFMVTLFRIPAFIVTLAMMLMGTGLAYRLAEGKSIPELPKSFFILGGGEMLGIPNPVWLMIALYLIAHIVMSRMAFGRYVYAIGGNEEAARLSGVPVKTVLLIVYTLSGLLAGLGGIIQASKLEAGDPKFGRMYELEVIAAVVVGGTSLMGGSGRIMGTLIGAFIIAVIKNGMNLTNVDPFNQKIVLGAVLLGAVLIDTLKNRKTSH